MITCIITCRRLIISCSRRSSRATMMYFHPLFVLTNPCVSSHLLIKYTSDLHCGAEKREDRTAGVQGKVEGAIWWRKWFITPQVSAFSVIVNRKLSAD